MIKKALRYAHLLTLLPAGVISLNFVAFALLGHGFLPAGDSDVAVARAVVCLAGCLIAAFVEHAHRGFV